MKTKLVSQSIELVISPIHVPNDEEIEDLVEQNVWIAKLSSIDSLEKLKEEKKDYPGNDDVLKSIELRDLIARLPPEIVRIGQKKVDGYPLTDVERKRLERFRKNPKWENKY
jgi:hypothetical protein